MTPRPPRLAVWLLTRRVADGWRDFILGDLEEEFAVRASDSPAAARRWFWRQTIRCLARPPGAARRVVDLASSPRGDAFMPSIVSDLRHAGRVLLRARSFSVAVIAVLALGIGANAAIFSIINTVLLRPLPFEEPDRLVRLFHIPPQATFPGIPRFPVSPANYYDWERDATSFERMAIYQFRQFVLTGGGQADAVLAAAVGDGFFDVVRTPPALGRTFRPEEDAPGARVVIVSDGFWTQRLGARPDAIGSTLTLDGEAFTVVGVMPPRFSAAAWGATGRQMWVPLGYDVEERRVRENHNAQVVARLSPGVTIDAANAEMLGIATRLELEYPNENAGWGATVIPLHELIVGDIRTPLRLLLAAVVLVLLIACANVGNLLFARGLARGKEIAIRSALGAGRRRVFQQLLIEAMVLAVVGGALGLLLAAMGLEAGALLLADQLPRADELSIDGRVLLFVLGVSIVAGLLAGVLPALRAGRSDLTGALKEGGRSEGAVGLRTRRALIVCEVALSVVLLMGAGVTLRTLLALRSVDAGFDPHNILTMRVSLPEEKYDAPEKTVAFFTAALERIRALPGVEVAGGIDDLPTQGGSVQPIVREGQAELLPRDQPTVEVRRITPDYLRAMNIPLLRGRDVAGADRETMLVSRSAAQLLWGDLDPIGTRVTLPITSRTVTREVIGVVGDVKQGELSGPSAPTVYLFSRTLGWDTLVLVARTSVPPHSLARPVEAVVRALDAQQPVEQIRTMTDVLDLTLTSQRFSAQLLGLFAGVALVLASVGIYSVLAQVVRGRSREISIRTALGARTGDVLRLVVFEGMMPALAGIAFGAAAALAAARVLETMAFGVSATDPLTLGIVCALLVVLAFLASLVPAYRAARLDPLKILRAS